MLSDTCTCLWVYLFLSLFLFSNHSYHWKINLKQLTKKNFSKNLKDYLLHCAVTPLSNLETLIFQIDMTRTFYHHDHHRSGESSHTRSSPAGGTAVDRPACTANFASDQNVCLYKNIYIIVVAVAGQKQQKKH